MYENENTLFQKGFHQTTVTGPKQSLINIPLKSQNKFDYYSFRRGIQKLRVQEEEGQ